MRVKIVNGVNINMLGFRNQNIYGVNSYDELRNMISKYCIENKIECDFFISNYEGEIVEEIQKTYFENYDGLIINPGAFTHYSYAIRDALEILDCLKIEVHITDINKREPFRKINVISDVCDYAIIGKGLKGYLDALDFIIKSRQHE